MTPLVDRRGSNTGWKFWSNLRLSNQLLLLLLFFNVPFLVAFHIYDTRATRAQIGALEKDTIEMLEPVVANAIEQSMLNMNRGHIRDLFAWLQLNESIKNAQLLDSEGRVLDTEGFLSNGELSRKEFTLPVEDLSRTSEIPIYSKPSCIRCHGSDKKTLGYIRLTTKSNRVRNAILRLNTVRAIMVVMGLLWLVLSIYLIVLRMVRHPMRLIIDGMEAIRRGRLDVRLPEAYNREFGRIFDYFNSMVRDIQNDRKQILSMHRKELAHLDRLATLGELSAHLAHEVRNPLTGIGSAIQVLRKDIAEDSPKRIILEKILEQLDRMDKTMSSFLRYARMPEAVLQSFKIHEPLNRILPILLPRLKAQKIELKVEVLESLSAVKGDAGQIEQSFLNLCINAAEAMPEGGILRIAAHEHNQMLRVEIADTGCGVKPENLEKILQPFYTTRENGSGLGLTLTKQIIMAHGGDLTLESLPGKGTSLFFTLPLNGASLSVETNE